MLHDAEGRELTRYARMVIGEALGGAPAHRPEGEYADRPAASFVTLHRNGRLHGCIGSIEARQALADEVASSAVGAALRDPRAGHLTLADVGDLEVEVSVLSALERVPARSAREAVARIRPGIDGVVLCYAGRRATFLPQVWRSLPDPGDFLAQLRLKAGLPRDFWADTVELYRYAVQYWIDPPQARGAHTS
jgi:hypothetical protein